MTTTAKTTVEFNGKTYPFYRTIRGQYDFEQAGFTDAEITLGKESAVWAKTYFFLRECAKRAGNPLKMTLNEFIDAADGETDVLMAWGRLLEAAKNDNAQEEPAPGK